MSSPDLWQEVWDECAAESLTRSPEWSTDDYYKSGRPSKAWPNKENDEWWTQNGPKFVELWELWRDNCGLEVVELPEIGTGQLIPGIEIEGWADGPDGTCVKSVTDRVMTDGTDLYIVDLKTGRMTQPWPLQLALCNLCLDQTYGVRAKFGGYWSARKGGIDPHWHNLSRFTDDWLWEQVWKAREIRDRQLFIPSPNMLCKSACGVQRDCLAMGGERAVHDLFFDVDATLTQVTPNQEKEETE